MATQLTDSEALQRVNGALASYISTVSEEIKRISSIAKDCTDNMGNDAISAAAVTGISDALKSMQSSLLQAQELQKKVQDDLAKLAELTRA